VLLEVRLAHAQDVARFLQGRQVRNLVAGVLDHEKYVHDGLGGKAWHRRGTDMFD